MLQGLDQLTKDLTQLFVILGPIVTIVITYLTLRIKSKKAANRRQQRTLNRSERITK